MLIREKGEAVFLRFGERNVDQPLPPNVRRKEKAVEPVYAS